MAKTKPSPAQLTFEQIDALRADIPTGLFSVLTHYEQLFVLHLLASPKMVLADAARAAGCGKSRAKQAGHELMQRQKVKAAVDAAVAARSRRLEVTADAVVNELRKIAFADPRRAMEWDGDGVRFIPSDEIDSDTAGSIAEVSSRRRSESVGGTAERVTVELKMRFHSKEAALALLAKHTNVVGGEAAPEGAEAQARAIRGHLDAMDTMTAAA